MSNPAKKRYDNVAIILHWVIALAIILMLFSGILMNNFEIEKSLKFNLYQWHKSLGLLILAAVILRILWRVFHKPPQLPESINKLEKKLSHLGHYGLYFLMFIMPVTGWLMVSSSSYGLPTYIFGWFEWPHIQELLPIENGKIAGNDIIHDKSEDAHEILAYVLLAMIAVHFLAVVKHYKKDGVNLLKRMWFRKNN